MLRFQRSKRETKRRSGCSSAGSRERSRSAERMRVTGGERLAWLRTLGNSQWQCRWRASTLQTSRWRDFV